MTVVGGESKVKDEQRECAGPGCLSTSSLFELIEQNPKNCTKKKIYPKFFFFGPFQSSWIITRVSRRLLIKRGPPLKILPIFLK